MALFDFFRKKNSAPAIRDLVWMNTAAKLRGCVALLAEHPDAVVAAWFSDTRAHFAEFMRNQNLHAEILPAERLTPLLTDQKTVLLLEHYPLKERETTLMESWTPGSVLVLSALDEPLFQRFGGENTIQLMQKLGMGPDEHLEHTLITRSIAQAQEKLASKSAVDHRGAPSAEAWFIAAGL